MLNVHMIFFFLLVAVLQAQAPMLLFSFLYWFCVTAVFLNACRVFQRVRCSLQTCVFSFKFLPLPPSNECVNLGQG